MRKTVIILFVIFSFFSCGKKEIKPETYESRMTKEAIAVADAIKDAYLRKDRSAIEKNSTSECYRDILGAIKNFDKAELTFEPKWADLDKSDISLKIVWNGTWVVKGQSTEERGTAVFVFEGSPLKLSRILRANPFRQPE